MTDCSPMRIRLSDERRRRMLRVVQRHFEESFDEPLSDFRAEQLLDLFVRELGPAIYNQAIQDACAFMQDKLADLEGELYEPGPTGGSADDGADGDSTP